MANETTVFKVSLDDSGSIKAKTNEMKAFNVEGSKAAKMAAAKAESRTYGQARAGGGTGAAGRDFAKESQGLGGLVRVYATFAANIFAVSAAYTALSNAVDTANLVQGLDQLGAASGKNLGTLSKRIVEVTDNAVSMREAMTATAQASSAGMSSVEILKMAKGAKQASQALGIDMGNALSRLSRGITKLEPELLDELGIFVRVDKASQDYAKSLGKSVGALTDVEKRAGFTKAVLDQLEKKFGGIDIPTNPYTQLLASLKNVTQSGLELVNTVLGPIVRLLAQSPTGLALAIAGVAGILIKQAVPALGAWRDNLNNLAKSSKETSERINTQFAEYQVKQSQKHAEEIAKRIEKEKAAVVASLNIAKGAVSDAGLKKGKIFDLIQNIPQTKEAETAAYKLLNSQISGYETRSRNLAASDAVASKAASDRAEALKRLRAEMPSLIRLETEFRKVRDAGEASMYEPPRKGDEAWQREKIAKDARIRAAKAEVLSNVAANTQVMGIAGAWSETKADIAKQGLKGLDAGVTKVRAGFAIATSAIGTFANALSGVFMIVGLVVTGVTLLVSALRSNAEKAAETTAAITALDEASKGAARTFEYWSKRDPLEQLTASGISAKASAIDEIAVAVKDAMDKAEKEIAGRNWMDSTVNWFAGLIGKDTESELAKSLAKGVVEAIKLAGNIPGTEGALKNLQLATGTTSTNVKDVANSLKGLPEDKLKNVVKQSEALSKVTKTLSSDVNNLKNSYDSLVKKVTEYTASVNKLDALGEIGQGMVMAAISLSKALDSPITSIGELNALLQDTAKLSLFPPDTIATLLQVAPEFNTTTTAIAGNIAQIATLNLELANLEQKYSNLDKMGYTKTNATATMKYIADEIAKNIDNLKDQIGDLKTANVTQVNSASGTFTALKNATIAQFTAGAKIVENSINQGFIKAGLTISKAYAGLLSGTVGGEMLSADISKKEIKLQAEQINVQSELIKATIRTAIAMDENTIAVKEKTLIDLPKGEAGQGRGSGQYRFGLEEDIGKLRSEVEGRKLLLKSNPYAAVSEFNKATLVSGTPEQKDFAKSLLLDAEKLSMMNSRVAEVLAGIKGIELSKKGQDIDRELKASNQVIDNRVEELGLERKLIEAKKSTGNLTQLEATNRANAVEEEERQLKLNKEMASYQAIISKALLVPQVTPTSTEQQKKDAAAAKATIEEAAAQQATLSSRFFRDSATQSALAMGEGLKAYRADLTKLEDFKIQTDTDTKTRALNLREVENSNAMLALDNARSFALISEDEYTRQKTTLELQKAGLDFEKESFNLRTASAAKILQLERNKQTASDLGELSAGISEDFTNRINAENTALEQQLFTLKLGYDAKSKSIALMGQGTERLTAYTELFKQGFKGMEDAIINFTKTGKLSFKGMIDSFIEGLLRFQIQKSQTAIFGQASDLAGSFISSLFGPSIDLTALPTGDFARLDRMPEIPMQPGGGYAKGGAWDVGVQAFAKGGMFTNSIVDSPTLFKFAKGTGLMGEAGPEAIMPLKRDANGNLGVRSGQSSTNVDVVVNNYSTAPATAKETTDSRGNRRIEVTVGDMIAQEVNRTGSTLQQSMTNTYGNRPALVRR